MHSDQPPSSADASKMPAAPTANNGNTNLDSVGNNPITPGAARQTKQDPPPWSTRSTTTHNINTNPTSVTATSTACTHSGDGNDQVTTERRPHMPLAAQLHGASHLYQSQSPTQQPASRATSPMYSDTAYSPGQPPGSMPPSAPQTQYSKHQHGVQQYPASVTIDHRSLYEEQISQQRSVLVNRYAPYIEHSDISLKDARNRLETALVQVRKLRSAFTERVYGKYRVCLRPAQLLDDTFVEIKTNPVTASKRLDTRIRQVKEEKELEKKEAATLNAEISKVDASLLQVSADNAEQLMYFSAGLSLVILPEDKVADPRILEGYQDRAPVNPATGQRVRSISQAAAAAGEVMLERTRKARAVRKQFQQQRKSDSGLHGRQELLQGNTRSPLELLTSRTPTFASSSAMHGTLETGQVVDIKPSLTHETAQCQATVALKAKPLTQQPKQPPPALPTTQRQGAMAQKKPGSGELPLISKAPEPSTSKFGRSRGGAGISVHVSLSLNPTADEITEQPSRSSTAALLARGAGTAQGIHRASPQQRLRHPHPTSAGGRQRASSAISAKKELATLIQAPGTVSASPQSYLHLALPPLPTPLDRRERKPLPALDPNRSRSARAVNAIASVLGNIKRSSGEAPLPKIELLHEIQKSRKTSAKNGAAEPPNERPIDPTLALSVLQAIGLITEAAHEGEDKSPVVLNDKVQKLSRGEKRRLESLDGLTVMWDKLAPSKKPRFSVAFGKGSQKKEEMQKPKTGPLAAAAATGHSCARVESIRGGGETTSKSNEDSGVPALREANARKNNQSAGGPVYGSHTRKNNQSAGGPAYGSHAHGRDNVDNRMLANSIAAQNASRAQPRWEGQPRQSLGIINPQLAGKSVSLGMNRSPGMSHAPGPVNAPVARNHPNQQAVTSNEQYQAHANYALNLAHQLRNVTNNMTGLSTQAGHGHGEVPIANFMNNLQSGQWSSIGSPAAAMAAAQSSLAALGLSVPMGVYSSVQDRAARTLLAREQQNVAAAHAVAVHQQSMATSSAYAGGAANPGFQRTTNQTIQQRAVPNPSLLNSAAQSFGVVNQSQVVASVAPLPPQQRSSVLPVASQAAHQGYARAVAEASRNSKIKPQIRRPALAVRSKRKTEDSPSTITGSDQARASVFTPSNPLPAKKPKQNFGGEKGVHAVKVPAQSQAALKDPPTKVVTGGQTPVLVVAATKPEAKAPRSPKGMHFFSPNAPAVLSSEQVQLVRTGQVHKLFGLFASSQPQNTSEILEYLVAVGTAVPIPKALIWSSLKDRLNFPGFKTLANAAGFLIPREIVVAVILVWLWKYHEEDFQRAFSKSGRIDVDPTCKWLVHAAVDASVRALTLYIAESEMTGSPNSSGEDGVAALESFPESTFSVALASASVVSKALTTESCRDDRTDSTLPQFHALARFLDECRMVALHSRSQERVLLASLISLKSVMSESFAHAYVSSIVRAGDAFGHEDLADMIGDDYLKISSMLPYDILRDGGGNWEDTCRPDEGFNPNLTGDVLTKVAHARAIIQKSLRRLQDRHGIKSGTPTFGAYVDMTSGQSNVDTAGSSASNSANKSLNGFGGTPKTWNKRKVSYTLEGPAPSGTGSAPATSWASYDPKHFSAPLAWSVGVLENMPYGRFRGGAPASLAGLGPNPTSKKLQISSATPNATKRKDELDRSTQEIDWCAVANSFDPVKLPRGIVSRAAPTPSFKTIISPFCRQLDDSPVPSDNESDTEEDISDGAVLARHQVVLDGMKEKLTAFLEARKKKQDRRKKPPKSDL